MVASFFWSALLCAQDWPLGTIQLSTGRGDGVSWLTGSETWNLVEDVFTPIPSTSHARRLSRITIGEGIEAYLSRVGFEIQLWITSFLPGYMRLQSSPACYNSRVPDAWDYKVLPKTPTKKWVAEGRFELRTFRTGSANATDTPRPIPQ